MFYLFNCIAETHSYSPIELSCCTGNRLTVHNTTADWLVIQSISRVLRKVSNITIIKIVFSFGIGNEDPQWRTNEAEVYIALFTHFRGCLTFRSCGLPQILHENSNFSELQWSFNACKVIWASDLLGSSVLQHVFLMVSTILWIQSLSEICCIWFLCWKNAIIA